MVGKLKLERKNIQSFILIIYPRRLQFKSKTEAPIVLLPKANMLLSDYTAKRMYKVPWYNWYKDYLIKATNIKTKVYTGLSIHRLLGRVALLSKRNGNLLLNSGAYFLPFPYPYEMFSGQFLVLSNFVSLAIWFCLSHHLPGFLYCVPGSSRLLVFFSGYLVV